VAIDAATGLGFLAIIYTLAVLIPALSVSVRRLHDTSRSGWWLLIGLVPLIGAIVVLVFTVQDSTPGGNDFGANPKDIGKVAASSNPSSTPPAPPAAE
jgi:uncharacterized membrane protein YhaH (DUF805 family)